MEGDGLAKRKLLHEEGAAANFKRSKADPEEGPETGDAKETEAYNLLYFSDDVLLCILRYCRPRELKALSFCCVRLARLCLDRSLWRNVELRSQAVGARSLAFYARCVQPSTTSLYVRGLIGAGAVSAGAPGPDACDCVHPDYIRVGPRAPRTLPGPEEDAAAADEAPPRPSTSAERPGPSGSNPRRSPVGNASPKPFSPSYDAVPSRPFREVPRPEDKLETSATSVINIPGTGATSPKIPRENGNSSPKPFSAAYEDYPAFSRPSPPADADKSARADKKETKTVADCCKYTNVCAASVTEDILNNIKHKCHNLLDLRLEYCNLDCNRFRIQDLPQTLKILSLKGSKHTTLSFQKPFLFRIQAHLPDLEEIDLSYCQWVNGHALILLSKLVKLRKLLMRGCIGLGECVAYASLSTRFGFKDLEILDIRGTSMGDSEVSSFGSILSLRELYLEPPLPNDESVFLPNEWPEHSGLMESWESENPHKEVEEYINMMNKHDYKEGSPSVDEAKNESAESKDDESSNKTENNVNGHNVNVYYRSRTTVNLSLRERQQQPNEVGFRVGVEVVPIGMQNPQGNHRMGGMQVGPVEVQVGPAGVQVGLGGVRVEPGWGQNNREGDAGVDRGRSRWMQIGPEGVQVGVENVQDRDRPADPNERPIGVRLGGIEVQVGAVSIEVAPGRQPNNPEDPERNPDHAQVDPNAAQPEERPGRQDDRNEHNFRRVEVPVGPFWMNFENENRENAPNHRVIELGVDGVHVRLRNSIPRNQPNQQNQEDPAAGAPRPENAQQNQPQEHGNNPGILEWVRMGPNLPAAEPHVERHNLMDGRVHVIYVDPRPRYMPARCAAHQGPPLPGIPGPHYFEMPLIQLPPFWPDVSHLRHLDGAELVTDASLLRLGDSEHLVHVGAPHFRRRPASRLEVLVCRGYRGVTDRSLSHLTTAAPSLRLLDVENCGVTQRGVVAFTMIRPDCVINFSEAERPDPPDEI